MVRRALNGVSYAEAVKKSQPKVNPARREAKAKLTKKVKISKSVAKQTQTQRDVSPADGDSTVPQQPPDSSPANLLPLNEASDPGFTPQKNVKAATEQTTNLNQNEPPAISSNLIKLEKENVLASATQKTAQNTDNAPSKNTKPEQSSFTQNPSPLSHRRSSVRGAHPYLREDTPKSLLCQADNVHSDKPIVVISESQPETGLKSLSVPSSPHQEKPHQIFQSQLKACRNAISVSSSLEDKPKQTKLRGSEQISIMESGVVKESLKWVPLQVNSKPGPKEDPAPVPRKCFDSPGVTVIYCERPSSTGTSKESQKPVITPHRPALSSVSTDSPHKWSTSPHSGPTADTLNTRDEQMSKIRSDERGEATDKGTPAMMLGQNPSDISAKVHHQIHTKTPAQANQVQTKTKQIENPPPKFRNREKEDNNTRIEETLQAPMPAPPSPLSHPRSEGRWHPFITDRSCVQKVRCQHRENGKLPKNVMKW